MSERKRTFNELQELAIIELAKPLHEQNNDLLREYIETPEEVPLPTSARTNMFPREVNPDLERLHQEELESHMPFAKRARTQQDNLAYVSEYNQNAQANQTPTHIGITKSISNLDLNGTSKPLIHLKTEQTEPQDDAYETDKNIYENPEFNLGSKYQYLPLPIVEKLTEIKYQLEKNNIIIIQGNTGCGKTTQVPMMILDHSVEMNRHCNIIVTQPRYFSCLFYMLCFYCYIVFN